MRCYLDKKCGKKINATLVFYRNSLFVVNIEISWSISNLIENISGGAKIVIIINYKDRKFGRKCQYNNVFIVPIQVQMLLTNSLWICRFILWLLSGEKFFLRIRKCNLIFKNFYVLKLLEFVQDSLKKLKFGLFSEFCLIGINF